MHVGGAFLDLSSAGTPHLWFICTEADADGNVVAISVSTVRANAETTCVLDVGDHPFVHHESSMVYRLATLVSVSELAKKRKIGSHKVRPDATPALLKRIREGALVSPMTPRNVKRAIRECPWQPPAAEDREDD